MSLDVPPMECTYLSLFISLEHLLALRTSTVLIKPLQPNSLGKATVIINFAKQFQFYRRHSGLVEKYNVSLRKLLQQGISEPEFYGDLVY